MIQLDATIPMQSTRVPRARAKGHAAGLGMVTTSTSSASRALVTMVRWCPPRGWVRSSSSTTATAVRGVPSSQSHSGAWLSTSAKAA